MVVSRGLRKPQPPDQFRRADYVSATFRHHGLVASRAEIDDGQSSVTQCHAGIGIQPGTTIIRPTVGDSCKHLREQVLRVA